MLQNVPACVSGVAAYTGGNGFCGIPCGFFRAYYRTVMIESGFIKLLSDSGSVHPARREEE